MGAWSMMPGFLPGAQMQSAVLCSKVVDTKKRSFAPGKIENNA
jgi:hypothetical protein